MPTATRSQATLAHFNFTSKSLSKKPTPSRDAEASFNAQGGAGSADNSDEGSSKYPKRPSPPHDQVSIEEESERTAKRLKSTHTEIPAVPLSPSPSPSQTTAGSSLVVPADEKVPHLDLKLVPPSPSKGKDRDVLHYTSVDNVIPTTPITSHREDEDVRMTDLLVPTTPRPREASLTLSALPTSPLTPLPSTPLPLPPSSPPHHASSLQYEEMFVKVKQTDGSLALSHDAHSDAPSSSGSRTPRSKTPTPAFPHDQNTNASRIPRSSTALTAITAKKGIVGRMRSKTGTIPSSTTPSTSNAKSEPSAYERAPTVPPPPKTPTHQRTRTVSTPGPSTARSRSKTPGRVDVPRSPELGRKNPSTMSISAPRTPARTRTLSESKTPRQGISEAVAVERSKTPGRVDRVESLKTPGRGRSEVPKTPNRGRSQVPKTPGRVDPLKTPQPPKVLTAPRSASRSRTQSQSQDGRNEGLSNSRQARPRTPARGSSIPRPKTPRAPSALPPGGSLKSAEVGTSVAGGSQMVVSMDMEAEVELKDVPVESTVSSSLNHSSSQLPDLRSGVPAESSTAESNPPGPAATPHPTTTTTTAATATETETTKKPLTRKRSASVAPGGVRMTRSASLRQQETKKQMDLKGKGKGRGGDVNDGGAASTLKTRASTVGPSRPPVLSSSVSSNPISPAKPRPPASTATSRPSLHHTSRTPSSSTSTSTSTHGHSFTSTRPRPPNSTSSIPSGSGGALSTLSMALEKLNMPPPSRPSTSLGFNENRVGHPNDDEGMKESTSMDGVDRVGKKRARDDSMLTKTSGLMDREKGKGRVGGDTKFEFRRATTVGPSSGIESGSGGGKKQTTLMLPPPVPRGTTSSAVASTSTSHGASTSGETKKPITMRNGMVGGKGRGGLIFGSGSGSGSGSRDVRGGGGGARGIFGVGVLPGSMGRAVNGGMGMGRVVHRASKVSSLPVVEGSPVKGGGREGGSDMDVDGDGDVEMKKEEDEDEHTEEMNPFAPIAGPSTPTPSNNSMDVVVPIRDSPDEGGTTPTTGVGNGRPSSGGGWRGHGRRASQAHQILSQTLSTLPQTPPKKKAPVSEGKRKAVDDGVGTSPSANTRSRDAVRAGQGVGIGARVSARRAAAAAATSPASAQKNGSEKEKEKTVERAKTGTPSGSGAKPKTLKILRHCNVYVDVRTDDGDDAGSLFVEMLTGLGARILGRVGQSCTHIVYKNGLVSTLTRYRLLNDPKPAVVGIGWVVECVEQRARVEETGFLIDIEHASIAGSNKRRRSMLPKHLLDSPERRPSGEEVAGPGPASEMVSSPSSEGTAANQSLESLPPLERARRRQSQLFGGRT